MPDTLKSLFGISEGGTPVEPRADISLGLKPVVDSQPYVSVVDAQTRVLSDQYRMRINPAPPRITPEPPSMYNPIRIEDEIK